MTPNEIKETRLHLGMSFRQFANALELQGRDAARTVRRYENGELSPSEVTQAKIKCLVAERMAVNA